MTYRLTQQMQADRDGNKIEPLVREIGSPRSQGQCETTLAERFLNPNCACATYLDNLGPCDAHEAGGNGRCAYCDHELQCNPCRTLELMDTAHWPGTWARGDKFYRWSISHRGDRFTLLAEIDRGARWFVVGGFDVDPVELELPEWAPPKFPDRGPVTRQERRRQAQAPTTTYLQIDGANQRGQYLRVRNCSRRPVKLKHGDVVSFRGVPKRFVVVVDFELKDVDQRGVMQVSPGLDDFTPNGAMVDMAPVRAEAYKDRREMLMGKESVGA